MSGADFLFARSQETLASAQKLRQQNSDWVNVYYLSGLSVEHMLWAIRCKTAGLTEPDHQNAPGHSIPKIATHAGLEDALKERKQEQGARQFNINWKTVCDWDSNSRFRQVSKADACDLHLAAANPTQGVMTWLRGVFQTLP